MLSLLAATGSEPALQWIDLGLTTGIDLGFFELRWYSLAYLAGIVLGVVQGELPAARGARLTDRLIRDAGIEPMLKSWMVIDNHDIPRIATQLPNTAQRRLPPASTWMRSAASPRANAR